jgi:hypothetical protein
MRSLGRNPEGARLERVKASPLWAAEQGRNLHPVMPGLRDPTASMPTLSEFICGGERRVPQQPLQSMNPLETWSRTPGSGCASPGSGIPRCGSRSTAFVSWA